MGADVLSAGIALTRRLQVQNVLFAGTVAESRDDSDTIVVLMAIVEHGGAISADELGDHLLGGGRRAVAERLLQLAEARSLVTRVGGTHWTVTSDGVTALRDRRVMAPSFGVWRAQLAEDELLGPMLLSLQRQGDQNLGGGISKTSGPPPLQRLPDGLLSIVGVPMRPVSTPTAVAQIVSVNDPAHGLVTVAGDSPVLEWHPATGALLLDGEAATAEPMDDLRVVAALAAGLHTRGAWDAEDEVLRLPADALSDREILACAISRTVPSIKLSQYGRFDMANFNDVPVRPVDDADANEWVTRRLLGRVDDYATSDRLAAWTQWATSGIGGAAPPREKVAERVAASAVSELYWHIHAPVDWGL